MSICHINNININIISMKVSSLHQIAVMWDGQFAVGATNTGKIYIWHLPTLRKVKIIDAHAAGRNIFLFLLMKTPFYHINPVPLDFSEQM